MVHRVLLRQIDCPGSDKIEFVELGQVCQSGVLGWASHAAKKGEAVGLAAREPPVARHIEKAVPELA